MWDSVDAVGQEQMPKVNYNKFYILLYIIVVLLICLLCLNLFVGVIIQSFYEEKEALAKNHLLKRSQIAWIRVQLLAYESKPIEVT